MPSILQKIRNQKYTEQNGRCFYCCQPMWSGTSTQFQMKYSVSERRAGWFQCTAEHLVAASEGGATSPENIVAACKFCNQTRHRSKGPLSSEAYKQRVLRRLECGNWVRLSPSVGFPM